MSNTDSRENDPVIAVTGLKKKFGSVEALRGLDLTVHRGEVHGFLGPNGSGKSTTIRVLLGLLRADGGSLRLLGGDPWQDAVALHHRLAYVPGDVALWPNLTGGEAIDVLTALRSERDLSRRNELLERFDLDPTRRCRTYSKGNRQKVALVAALTGNVELLILDEPTSGLDPLMEAVFTDCVGEAVARGTTVLLSSHILAEVEKLCDEVTIIRDGAVVQSGTLDELRHLTRTTVQARMRHPLPPGFTMMPGIRGLEVAGESVRFEVEPDSLDSALGLLAATGLVALTCQPPTLEEIFLGHYSDDDGNAKDGTSDRLGAAQTWNDSLVETLR